MSDKKTRIVIMGCGGSGGVPYAGNIWDKCDPKNPKNRRTRPSVYIAKGDTRIVIDTAPEFRQQLNATGHTGKLDAVLYTHAHADHIAGIDDLRALWHANNKTPVTIYAEPDVLRELHVRYDYLFEMKTPLYPALLYPKEMTENLTIGDINIRSFAQEHSFVSTVGFRIGDFAYSTDAVRLSEQAFKTLEGTKIWVVGAHIDPNGNDGGGHAGLNTIKEWSARIKPDMIYLTHLNASGDYDELCKQLPANIRPAYDGLEFEI